MNRFLNGKRALVVGGSGGIGRAVSLCIAECGAALCIHGGHDRDRLRSTADAARRHDVEVTEVFCELTGPREASAVLEAAGDVDVLVVSFGPYLERPLSEMVAEDWERMVGLNLVLPGIMVSRVLPAMISRSWGRILLFGGPRSDVIRGYRLISAYATAKHGLASLARSVAVQHARDGIRCNMICPGHVDTEYYPRDRRERMRSELPSGRLVDPDEIAALARYLLSPESDAVNGALIPVDFGV